MGILIQNLQDKIQWPLELEELLERTVKQVLVAEGVTLEAEVGIILVDNEQIRSYNTRYRGIDSPTDVLSFPQFEPGEDYKETAGEFLLGDIMISLERAVLQAREFGHSLAREVAYLTVHGLYHLLGYDHGTPSQQERMREREEKALAGLGLGRQS